MLEVGGRLVGKVLVLVLVEVGSINLGGWSACGGGWEVGRQGASSSVTKLSTGRKPEEGIHCSCT